MGQIYSPQLAQIGSVIGQTVGPQPQSVNYCSNGTNITWGYNAATNWVANGAVASANLAYSIDNGFSLSQLNAVGGIADFYSLPNNSLYTTTSAPAKQTDRINTFSCYVLAAPTGPQSPQARFEARLTGGVARNLSIDFNPQTGVLIGSLGAPNTVGIQAITVPLLNGVENVRAFRVWFSCDVLANNAAELRCYPRSDGGAAGSCVFGGIQIDGMVSSPLAFCTTVYSGAGAGAQPAGSAPHQTLSPRLRVKNAVFAAPGIYTVDPRTDQDTWLIVTNGGATSQVQLPITSAILPQMPPGSELLLTLGAGTTAINLVGPGVNNIYLPTESGFIQFSALTFPGVALPGATGLRLNKNITGDDWTITEILYSSFASSNWVKVGNALGFAAFQAAAFTNSVALFPLGAGGIIQGIKIKHSAAFTGGAIASMTMSVGLIGNVNKYAAAFNVFQAPGNTIFQLSGGLFSEDNAVATQVYVTATSTGAVLNALATGSVDIWALLSTAL